MSLAGRRRGKGRTGVFSYICAALILVLPMLQLWLCGGGCTAAAVRLAPGDSATWKPRSGKAFHELFGGRNDADFNGTTVKGFEEAKRRVPSCPDPLHN